MAEPKISYQLFPLGDSAITIDLGNCIDEQLNRRVLSLSDWLEAHRFHGVLDIIVAYSSVSVFVDPLVVRASGIAGSEAVLKWVGDWLERAWRESAAGWSGDEAGRQGSGGEEAILPIPVCYEGEYAPDLDWAARQTGLSAEEVVSIHSNGVYRVYMVGFLPGFSYMGVLDERIQLPRKLEPVPVVAGGVGIAGMQTGIYPLNSPGGWQIIGRTPLTLFRPDRTPAALLHPGNRLRFKVITAEEFESWT